MEHLRERHQGGSRLAARTGTLARNRNLAVDKQACRSLIIFVDYAGPNSSTPYSAGPD
jgi:hypothetical protein